MADSLTDTNRFSTQLRNSLESTREFGIHREEIEIKSLKNGLHFVTKFKKKLNKRLIERFGSDLPS